MRHHRPLGLAAVLGLVVGGLLAPGAASATVSLGTSLTAGEVLTANGTVTSPSGAWRLTVTADGRLVEQSPTGTVLWTSLAAGPGASVVVRADGDVVLRRADGTTAWHAATTGSTSVALQPRDDGNVLVRSAGYAVWNRTRLPASYLSRAQSWVDARVPYDRARVWTNRFGSYRQDCSGYVSMVWALGRSASTTELTTVAHRITAAELRPGDVLLNPGVHVALFAGWANSAHTAYWTYEEYAAGATFRKVPYPYWTNTAGYQPYRRG